MNMVSGRRAFAAFVAFSVLTSGVPLAALAAPAPAPAVVTAADAVFPQFGFNAAHSFAPNVTGRGYNDSLIKWKLPIAPSAASTAVANFSSDVALYNTTGKP